METLSKVTIRKCTLEDLLPLRELGRRTYDDTFRKDNTPENTDAYLDYAFELNKVRKELENPASHFFFLYEDTELAGYLKVNDTPAQTELNDPEAMEIERIYVDKEFHGKGYGYQLMEKALELAREAKKTYVWLGVWEKNEKALAFYYRQGFEKIGVHSFFMGDDEQFDFILRLNL